MNTSTVPNINPRIYCIEDDRENSEMILDELKRSHGFQIEENFINLKSKEEYCKLIPQIQNELALYSIFIIDVSLGQRVNKDGIEIAKMISTTFSDYDCIFHTAFPDERDIWKKNKKVVKYIVKSNGSEIEVAETINEKIYERSISNTSHHLPTRKLHLKTDNLPIKSTDLLNFKTVLNIDNYDTYIQKLSVEKRLFLADFILSSQDRIVRSYLDEKWWILEPLSNRSNRKKNFLYLNTFFDKTKAMVSLHISRNSEVIVEMGKVDLDYLVYFLKEPNTLEYLHENDSLEAFLVQYFFAKIIANCFINREILGQAPQRPPDWNLLGMLSIEMRRFVFLPTVWELITKKQTRNSDETKAILKEASAYCGIEIDDMFYGELTEIEDDKGLVKLVSIENEKLVYYRKMRMAVLEKSGIKDIDTPFRLILYSGLENSNPGDTQLIIRTTHYSKF